MSNYAVYPQKVVDVSQRWDGSGHRGNSTGSPADYPIDISINSGSKAFYAPCRMKCKKIQRPADPGVANGAWFTSTEPVDFPDGTRDLLTIKFVHMENSDFGSNGIYVGRVYEKYEFVGYEGASGEAYGNHLHVTAGKGNIKNGGIAYNSLEEYVLQTTGGQFKPEELLYVDRSFTTIANTAGLNFRDMPTVKYPNGTICRLAQGAPVYFDKDAAQAALYANEPCVKVWNYENGAHPYFISAADWDGSGNNDTGTAIGWVDEASLSMWSPKYENYTLLRLAKGSAVYYTESTVTVAHNTPESMCVKVWGSKGANHPYFICAPGWTGGDGSDGYGTAIGWVGENSLSPWSPALTSGQLYRLKEGTAIYAEKNKYTGQQYSDNMSCVKLFNSEAGVHPCFISTSGWNGNNGGTEEHGIGWIDESALSEWTQSLRVGQKVKYWGGKVFGTPNGIVSGSPTNHEWTVAEIVAYNAAEHPYQIKDLHTGQILGWVSEYTVGAYTLSDVTACSQYVAGKISLSEDQIRIYDMNNDGKLSLSDVTAISKIVSGQE